MSGGLRSALKHAVEAIAGAPAVVRGRVRARRGRVLVLSYHNVIPAGPPLVEGDRSLHLPLDRFQRQLDTLDTMGLTVRGLDAAAADDAPTVVVTFDDAYRGAIELALPELAARAMACTVFVAPGLLGNPAPWWDRLADPALGAIPPAVRDAALTDCAGDDAAVLSAALQRHWPLHAPHPLHGIASLAELRTAMASSPLATVGSHTWSHPNLAALSGATLVSELERPRATLRDAFGERYVDHLAYPYGLESAAVRAATRAAGYRSAFRVVGGWSSHADDAFARPRLNVTPGISDAGFRARLAGLIG